VAEGYSELDNLKAKFEELINKIIARAKKEGRPLSNHDKRAIAILKGEEQGVEEGKLGATAALAGAIALGGAMGYKHATKDPNAEPSAFKTKHQHAFDAGKNLKKKIAGDQKNEGVAEDTDQEGYHTRVQRGDFRPSKYGEDEYNYLHDLMNTSGDGSSPMLVTINDKKIARQIAAMYGGDVEETGMGTYRIVQRRGESPMGNKRPKLTGVAEGSTSKEKQKTPHRDINSPEYKAAAEKQKEKMAKDQAAEPGKKLLDKIEKKDVAEDSMDQISRIKKLSGLK